MTVISISGIRGIVNHDLMPAEIVKYATGFATLTIPSQEYFIGRDTRSTGELLQRLVCGVLLGTGARVQDYGVISTPALFRESRARERPAIMITASHNEPEWNGIKFIVNGRGIVQAELDSILLAQKRGGTAAGAAAARAQRDKPATTKAKKRQKNMKSGSGGRSSRHAAEGDAAAAGPAVLRSGRLLPGPKPSYGSELIRMAGEGSCDGVKVVVDLNGSAAIMHAPEIFRRLGCNLTTLGGAAGVFTRVIDPTNDDLEILSRTVRDTQADIGFAFDCDGDRLVIVDNKGEKKTGDYMLTLAIKEILPSLSDRSVVVSADTTQAIDEEVSKLGGKIYRSKVGEANVISKMLDEKVSLGGEGSSGGLIHSDFNYCRDSMLAAITIAGAIKEKGTGIFEQVRSYQQARLKVSMERKHILGAIKKLQKEYPDADPLDGFKLTLSQNSWVLIRPSGTENAARVSAEAPSTEEADRIARSFLNKLKRLGRVA